MSFLYPLLNFLQPGIFWPQLAPFKPMLLASALALLAAVIGPRQETVTPGFAKPPVYWMIAFVIVQGLSFHASGGFWILHILAFWYIYPVFVVLSVLLLRDEKSLQRYCWGMLLGSMFVVGYGIYAKYSGINSVLQPGEIYSMQGRAGAYGMYQNQNDYSFIIVQILPFLYAYWRTEPLRMRRVLLLAAMATCVAGMMLCLSRGGMLAMLLEMFLIAILTMRRSTLAVLLPLLVMVAVGGISYQWKMRAEDQGSTYTYAESESTRLQLWHAARLMIEAHPILGVGSMSFGEYAKDYAPLSHDDLGKNAHNTYLDVAATSGFTGLTCFLAMIWTTLKLLRRRHDAEPGDRLEAIRLATLISLLTIVFRAALDAKEHDWSFYVLTGIALGLDHLFSQRALRNVNQLVTTGRSPAISASLASPPGTNPNIGR